MPKMKPMTIQEKTIVPSNGTTDISINPMMGETVQINASSMSGPTPLSSNQMFPMAAPDKRAQRRRTSCWLCESKENLVGEYCSACIEGGFVDPIFFKTSTKEELHRMKLTGKSGTVYNWLEVAVYNMIFIKFMRHLDGIIKAGKSSSNHMPEYVAALLEVRLNNVRTKLNVVMGDIDNFVKYFRSVVPQEDSPDENWINKIMPVVMKNIFDKEKIGIEIHIPSHQQLSLIERLMQISPLMSGLSGLADMLSDIDNIRDEDDFMHSKLDDSIDGRLN